ncbi:hypothetical protein [Streptomonospora litoralis]|uniref:Uncharacterized protein n=1 Tax=Streptomonospora litoralis TaxID=2498135 RepID=A0A4V0ZJN8_9ACTN|nr:hypothetical protein [Streptomonospora litoralis]QBI54132.1 hypothetical protein EKD16_11745 [Streptomonospora litoralis]
MCLFADKGLALQNVVTVWRRSTAAEMCWAGSGGPAGIPVVPLVWDDLPCVALPMAHLDAVDTMTSGRASFAVSDPPSQDAAAAVVASGPVDIRFDLEGKRFADHLLEQEIVKHPPTRLRADGLMARRENWWWMPRVLITLTAVEDVRPLPPRTRGDDALLVRPGPHGGAARVDTVTARAWPEPSGGGEIELWRRDGSSLEGTGEPAFAFAHRHSPDFERWERWYRSGRAQGEVLTVTAGTGTPEPESPRPYNLLARYRNHREVVRACRAGIAKAEARAGNSGAG